MSAPHARLVGALCAASAAALWGSSYPAISVALRDAGPLSVALVRGIAQASIIIVAIIVTGKGVRLGACLYVMYLLHWLCLHATTLPPPDDIVWKFPDDVFTFGRPSASDFWFSGHVANAFVIALATAGSRPLLKALAWSLFAFEILLVLSARTHYTIDVIGALFVGYSIHRLSLDLVDRFQSPFASLRSS